jgi:hypothetical protein
MVDKALRECALGRQNAVLALHPALCYATRQAALAQLVEHRIRNAGVTGSSPVGGTIFLFAPSLYLR